MDHARQMLHQREDDAAFIAQVDTFLHDADIESCAQKDLNADTCAPYALLLRKLPRWAASLCKWIMCHFKLAMSKAKDAVRAKQSSCSTALTVVLPWCLSSLQLY